MPRFYFNLHNGETILDQTGVELPEVAAVLQETVKATAELLSEVEGDKFWSSTPWKLWVTDRPNGDGEPIFILQFRPMCLAQCGDRAEIARYSVNAPGRPYSSS